MEKMSELSALITNTIDLRRVGLFLFSVDYMVKCLWIIGYCFFLSIIFYCITKVFSSLYLIDKCENLSFTAHAAKLYTVLP